MFQAINCTQVIKLNQQYKINMNHISQESKTKTQGTMKLFFGSLKEGRKQDNVNAKIC